MSTTLDDGGKGLLHTSKIYIFDLYFLPSLLSSPLQRILKDFELLTTCMIEFVLISTFFFVKLEVELDYLYFRFVIIKTRLLLASTLKLPLILSIRIET